MDICGVCSDYRTERNRIAPPACAIFTTLEAQISVNGLYSVQL